MKSERKKLWKKKRERQKVKRIKKKLKRKDNPKKNQMMKMLLVGENIVAIPAIITAIDLK